MVEVGGNEMNREKSLGRRQRRSEEGRRWAGLLGEEGDGKGEQEGERPAGSRMGQAANQGRERVEAARAKAVARAQSVGWQRCEQRRKLGMWPKRRFMVTAAGGAIVMRWW